MSPKIILRALALTLAAGSFAAIHLAAQDAPSVAEAARRARQQKQDAAKPAKVIDNDAIPPSPNAAAPAVPPAASAPTPGTASNSSTASRSVGNDGDEAQKKAEIESLKQQIADKKEKINLQQRELALAQDTFLSNADHAHDKAGKDKLDSMQATLSQLQSELSDLEAKLAALGPEPETKAPETPKS